MLRLFYSLALTLCALTLPAQADEPVKMMTNTWPPYVDQQLPEQGLAVELVTHIFARAGYKVDNTIESWPRAMEGVDIGLYDVLGAAWKNEAREQQYAYSEPYLMNELIIVKRRDMKGKFYSLDALRNARLGLSPDYAYGVDFAEIPGVKIVYENHIIQNLTNLLNGKVDFVVGDRNVIAQQLKDFLEDRRQEIDVISASLPPRSLHVAGSRASERPARLVREFNDALQEVKRDGSYQKIIEKWRERYAL
jgi:polar amino acid transport system substrate-binding protein